MKILIAEDDVDSRIYLERMLKGNGFLVDSADNGVIALQKARTSPPDLILSDILMPEMDGFAFFLQLKQDSTLKQIPFVFYTATYTGEKDRQLAMSIGAARFVIKPQPPENLIGVIREVLAQQQANGKESSQTAAPENGVITQYSEALFRKLAKKVGELEQEVSKRRRIEEEILQDAEIARRVQQAMLSPLESSPYIEINTIYHPHHYVGGDLYFLDWRNEGMLLRGFVLEAIGHGLGTALYSAAQHVMLREINESDLPLPKQLHLLNRRMAQHFPENNAVDCLAFELDFATHELRWVAAGFPRLWSHSLLEPLQRDESFPALSGAAEQRFSLQTIPLDTGNCFYFCTAGLSRLLANFQGLPLSDYPQMVGILGGLAVTPECLQDATAVCIKIRMLPDAMANTDSWPKQFRLNGYGDYLRLQTAIAQVIAAETGTPHSLPEVALHEALANAMECRDAVARPHRVQLKFNKLGRKLIARVKTSRIGFAGNAILRRLQTHPEELFAYGEDASMGRGIPLMLSLSQRMVYNADGTELLLVWKI